jgi:Fic family protein
MLKSGYWLFEYLTISRAILAAPIQYHHSFQFAETDENDLTYSIMFMLRITHKAITKMREYLAHKQAEQNQIAAVLKGMDSLNPRQRELIQSIMEEPRIAQTFKKHSKQFGVSLLTARADLLGLVRRGLLRRIRWGRQHAFYAADDLVRKLQKTKSP